MSTTKPFPVSRKGRRQIMDALARGSTLLLDEHCPGVAKDYPPDDWPQEEKRAFDLITGTESSIEDQLNSLFDGLPASPDPARRPAWVSQHAIAARCQTRTLVAAYEVQEQRASESAREAHLAEMQAHFNALLDLERGHATYSERVISLHAVMDVLDDLASHYPPDVFPEEGTGSECAAARFARRLVARVRAACEARLTVMPDNRLGRSVEHLKLAVDELFEAGPEPKRREAIRTALCNIQEASHPPERSLWRTTLHGIALAPCRYCGSDAEWIHFTPEIADHAFQIKCGRLTMRGCRMAPQTPPCESAQEAASLWNQEPA